MTSETETLEQSVHSLKSQLSVLKPLEDSKLGQKEKFQTSLEKLTSEKDKLDDLKGKTVNEISEIVAKLNQMIGVRRFKDGGILKFG